MGMTIEEKFKILQDEYTHLMGMYQMMQADYEARLKADLIAMLTELQLEILELKSYESADGQDLIMLADIGILLNQKIDKLREGEL